jgi:hypothetical protein
VDADGNIYIVETKLYKNPDKRTVVAQVLDYGATIWSYYNDFTEFLARLDTGTKKKFGVGVREKIKDFFQHEEELQTEELLESVKTNLNKGIFRFVVLMDHLEDRLKDLILFINKNSQFDVYAVEIEYYKFDKHELMIPRIFGTEVKKDLSVASGSASARKKWDKDMYFAELKNSVSPEGYELSERLYNIVTKLGDVSFGTGTSLGSYSMRMETKNGNQTVMHQWTDGRLEALSGYFSEHALSGKYRDKILATIKYSKHKISKNWYRVDINTNDLTEEDSKKLVEIYKEIKTDLML